MHALLSPWVMKILLDENIAHDPRSLLVPMHEVFTVGYLRWDGIENGRLLSLAASNGFQAIVTTDRGMEYGQKLTDLPCSVIVLLARTNKAADLRQLIPELLSALPNLAPKSFLKIGARASGRASEQ